MRVLVVGGGGREHTMAWALSRSARVQRVYCAPGNAGTAGLGTNVDVGAGDAAGILEIARRESIDLVAVGPEDPLAAGLADTLSAAGLPTFGPSAAAARLEGSKWFAKELMARAGVRTARGKSFRDEEAAHAFIDELTDATGSAPVIKADGLAAGKGVIVPADAAEAHAVLGAMLAGLFGAASESVVVEERLTGLEASAMAFVDGATLAPMPFACDYKRALDGDEGPNTGGMGVYSPPGFLAEAEGPAVFAAVHEPVVRTMAAEGAPFAGVLYAGLMVADGESSVVEFNVRFGDPEAQVILPQLETDLVEVMEACIEGRLAHTPIEWSGRPTVGVAMASGGYPGSYETGKPITGLEAVDDDVLVFHAGTKEQDDGSIVTSGGRVLTVVASGSSLSDARERAYDNVARIAFEGRMYRTDIALRELSPVGEGTSHG